MIKSLIYSITFHSVLVLLTILSLPFMLREPIDIPSIDSVELIEEDNSKDIATKMVIPIPPALNFLSHSFKCADNHRTSPNYWHLLIRN